jgi:predicted Ser/Thr protein kinase
LARLPADERIHRLRADRWIGYPRAVEALNRLEALYTWPNKQRMPNLLLLVGPTNNGKSMIVEKFRRAHRPAPTTRSTSRYWSCRCRPNHR